MNDDPTGYIRFELEDGTVEMMAYWMPEEQ